MMNRTTFYSYVRRAPFGGKITPEQMEGLEKILNYWDKNHSDKDPRWLAYALATTFHETAATMQPIEERGGQKYLRSKKYYPWIGRGLVQITWEENYKKYGILKPEDALLWPKALFVLFDGMIMGRFTGKRLSQYFNDTVEDPRGARKIVNGTDKAGLIADYYTNFKGAILAATAEETPKDVRSEDKAPDSTPITKDTQAIAVAGTAAATSVIAAVSSPWGVLALVVLVVGAGLGLYIWSRQKEKFKHGV